MRRHLFGLTDSAFPWDVSAPTPSPPSTSPSSVTSFQQTYEEGHLNILQMRKQARQRHHIRLRLGGTP